MKKKHLFLNKRHFALPEVGAYYLKQYAQYTGKEEYNKNSYYCHVTAKRG